MIHKFKQMSSREKKIMVNNFIYVLIGNMVLAFGSAVFLTTLNIVAGGVSGLGIIAQYFFGDFFGGQIVDITIMLLTWVLWLVGLIFVGKSFAWKTLASSIIYPVFVSMFLRFPVFIEIAEEISYYGMDETLIASIKDGTGSVPISNLLINSIFGAVLVGTGVALNFKGGGSSGGVDVIMAIFNKYLGFKESSVSFIIDSTIILVAMFAIPHNIIPSLCGILSATITALMIEIIYVGSQTSYQVDIISEKWQEISSFAQDKLGRGATIIRAEGGYKGDERIILRIVFHKSDYNKIKEFIAVTDPKAFVTFTQTNAVFGEGFRKSHHFTKTNKNKEKK